MNRSYGNLPIAWANSPSIVFNKRTSGWMPPAYSTLAGRNQIVQVDDNMNFVKELSNDFPTAQVAVWDTTRGQIPPGAIAGPPLAPGAASLSGWGDLSDYLSMDGLAYMLKAPLLFFSSAGRAEIMAQSTAMKVVTTVFWLAVLALVSTYSKGGSKILNMIPGLGWLSKKSARVLRIKKNPIIPRRWKSKKYAKRHGRKGKMSASYMKRHSNRRRRNRR